MNSINTIEGLLFRSYLTGYNLSVLHKCMKANDDDFKNQLFRKVSFANSDFQFERILSRAKELTERYVQYCEKNAISMIAYFDKQYPQDLLSIKDFPPVLFVKGNLSGTDYAAVVGSREMSPLAFTKIDFIIKTFAGYNYGIISGLALGIDTLAHEAAMKYNLPTTAVMPTSIDNIYPKENVHLVKTIIDRGGAIVSEQAPNYGPLANPFVLRNRIIAALSDYLIPVEMGKDSGTRHAVQYAVRYGKKLILCLPNSFEIDNYLKHYDGIIVAAKKYKVKENTNVILIRSLDDLIGLIKMDFSIHQQKLF